MLTQLHFYLSIGAVLCAIAGIYLAIVKHRYHRYLGGGYIVLACLAILMSSAMTIYFWINPDFAIYNQNPSSNFLRQWGSWERINFGYANAQFRALLFLITLFLAIFPRRAVKKNIQICAYATLGILSLDSFVYIFSDLSKYLFVYYFSVVCLILQVSAGLLLIRLKKISQTLQHSFWAILGLSIFVETGLLGGARGYVWSSLARSIPIFIAERVVFFVLPFICLWLLVRSEKFYFNKIKDNCRPD